MPVQTIISSRTVNVLGAQFTFTQPSRFLPLKSGTKSSANSGPDPAKSKTPIPIYVTAGFNKVKALRRRSAACIALQGAAHSEGSRLVGRGTPPAKPDWVKGAALVEKSDDFVSMRFRGLIVKVG